MVKKLLKLTMTFFLGKKKSSELRLLLNLFRNYINDARIFIKHSILFHCSTLNNIECQLILYYHSIEKGLLFDNMKPRFAQSRVEKMHNYMNDDIVKNNICRSQIKTAYQILCLYYELHAKNNIDISDFFTEAQYNIYKNVLGEYYEPNFKGAISYSKDEFYKHKDEDFFLFSHSRKSVRDFDNNLVPKEKIARAVSLALNTPSVCNRQAWKVYSIHNKDNIDDILKIQGGFSGYIENVQQLMILSMDISYFYTAGERNQFYVDGGMFLMNLLYAFHYYEIAACPANWCKTINDEIKLSKIVKIPDSEKIICVIPIGTSKNTIDVTLSKRRDLEEVLFELD